MKPRIFKFYSAWILFCFLASSIVWAGPQEEKRRTINKSYKVGNATEINLSNSFGKVHVDTWNKKQVDVSIEIIVKAGSDSRARELLDRISIHIDDSDPMDELSFSTSINGKNSGRNTSFEVNYRISMPGSNKLECKNSFGDVYIGAMTGEIELDVQYGNLNTRALSGNAEIRLAFGSGISKIEELRTGELRLSYSKLNIEHIGVAEVNSQFSTLEIETAGKLELTGKYGEIRIGEIEELEADMNFSGFEIGQIGRILDLDIDYGGNIEIRMSERIERVEIENSFGPLRLVLPTGLNADINVNLSFCDLKNGNSGTAFSKIQKNHTSSKYEGKVGKGGDAIITVTSKYGSVRLE